MLEERARRFLKNHHRKPPTAARAATPPTTPPATPPVEIWLLLSSLSSVDSVDVAVSTWTSESVVDVAASSGPVVDKAEVSGSAEVLESIELSTLVEVTGETPMVVTADGWP